MRRLNRKDWEKKDGVTLGPALTFKRSSTAKRAFDLLRWVCLAASLDEHRVSLCGILVEEKKDSPKDAKEYRIIGCDGRRLHVLDEQVTLGLAPGVYIVTKLSKTAVELSWLEDGPAYPSYQQVVPFLDSLTKAEHRYPMQDGHVARICMDTGLLLDVNYLKDMFFSDDYDQIKRTTSPFDVYFDPAASDRSTTPAVFHFDKDPKNPAKGPGRWGVIMPIRKSAS
jgi:hypothetical protein